MAAMDTTGLAVQIKSGELTSVAAIESALATLERVDPVINACPFVFADQARAAARAADQALADGRPLGRLHGSRSWSRT